VPFEITQPTRESLQAWPDRRLDDWLFPSRSRQGAHITSGEYGRLIDQWVTAIELDPEGYGTHSLGRTEVALIYKRTGNLRACQLLLGYPKIESTMRYLDIEVDDALTLSEQVEI
jgi:site-specific recombinase XerD